MKIKTLNEIRELTAEKKTVLCHGEFDLLHIGHQRYFKKAKEESAAEILIVTITPDRFIEKGAGRPVFNEKLRAEAIANLEFVDYVAVNEWETAIETIKLLRPNFYAKGSEYLNKIDVTGRIHEEEKIIKEIGGKMIYVDDIQFSASQLLNSYFNVYPENTLSWLKTFKKKYGNIKEKLQSLKDKKVLVIGEAIIDEYCYVQPKGKSPKNNILTTQYISEEKFAGGAIATANHISEFCQVELIASVGNINSHRDFIDKHCNTINFLFTIPDTHTVLKKRFIDPYRMQKLFEIGFFEDKKINTETEELIIQQLTQILKRFDCVILNDFGHNFFTKKIIDTIIENSNYLCVNTQTNSSNEGFNLITKYKKANYVCIDEHEARLAVSDRYSNILEIFKKLFDLIDCEIITITLGKNGCAIADKNLNIVFTPVFTTEAIDTIGAGDAFLALSSITAKDFELEEISFVGNAAGALKVKILGNKDYIKKMKLEKFIETLLKV